MVTGRGVQLVSGRYVLEPELSPIKFFWPGIELCLLLDAVDVVLDGAVLAWIAEEVLVYMTSRMRSCA